jgi:TetR/AcrR family transcriptional regulator, tetracycline repressor protein
MSATDHTQPLSAEAIVEAALEIADADGPQAVSMRRVGARLGVAAMALYRHIANKDALLELMADHVLAELPHPDPSADWRDEMMRFWTAFHDLLLEHPAVAYVMLDMPVAGNELAVRGELVLASLIDGGLDEASAAEALTSLTWYTVGGALYAIGRSNPKHVNLGARLALLSPDEFPSVRRAAPHFAADTSREYFIRGLEHLIRGYEPR